MRKRLRRSRRKFLFEKAAPFGCGFFDSLSTPDNPDMTQHKTSELLPKRGEHYRHQDGGLYRVEGLAKSSVDLSDQVVYRHLWPFEQALWTRPVLEWTAPRFLRVSAHDVRAALKGNRATAQAAVEDAKRRRRAMSSQAPAATDEAAHEG